MARHHQLVRLFTALSVAGAATAFAVVGPAPLPASAATACGTPDLYAHKTFGPSTLGGASDYFGSQFGATMAVGDFNRDGYADVAVGAPTNRVHGSEFPEGVSSQMGTVTVLYGSSTGLALNSTGDSQLYSLIGGRFGAALAAGDFNGDGYADLAVGVPGYGFGLPGRPPTASNAGEIVVYPGSSAGLSASTGTSYSQTLGGGTNTAGDAFGSALAAGDLNGDGFADLAIGAPGRAPNGGAVHSGGGYVYKGSSGGIVNGWQFNETDAGDVVEAGDLFGSALAVGNVTGDGHADLVVGAPGEGPGSDPAGSGAVYVIPGASSGHAAGFGRNQSSDGDTNEAGDGFGSAVAVGDFDKDGYGDIAVGVPGEAPGTGPTAGTAAVFPGASSQLAAGYVVDESSAGEAFASGDRFGGALSTGDVDGDGYADLLIGAPFKSYGAATNAGAAYLFRGGPRQTGATRSLTVGSRITQADAGAPNTTDGRFGSGVGLGNFSNHQKADAVIGSPFTSNGGIVVGGVGPAVGSPAAVPNSMPTAGIATELTNLGPRVGVPVGLRSFTPTVALQGGPVAGGSVGAIDYAYTDNIGRLLHGHQSDPNNTLSVQWTVFSTSEAFTGVPGLAQQQDGELAMVAHDTNGSMAVNTETANDPPVWGGWNTPLGVSMASAPVFVRQGDGTLVAFAIDSGGVLWALPQKAANDGYPSWVSLGVGGLSGIPVAVAVSGGVQVFALSASGVLTTVLYANRVVAGCSALAGSGFTGQPSVVVYPGSRLRVFARAADGSIQTMVQDQGGVFPGAWDTVGSFTVAGSPAALLSLATGKTELVARGADGLVYSTGETVQGSGTWRDWRPVTDPGIPAATDPTAFSYATGSGVTWAFVYRDVDNQSHLYEATSVGIGPQTARAATAGPVLNFVGHTLPAPPNVATAAGGAYH